MNNTTPPDELIDESLLLKLGFVQAANGYGRSEYRFAVPIEDPSEHEWADVVVNRGNGSDPDCWDLRFRRQDGNRFRPMDTVTLRYGARRMSEVTALLYALEYRPNLQAQIT